MEKQITVHYVQQGEKKYLVASKSKADEAVKMLAAFGVEAEAVKEKRTVAL